MKNDIFSYTLAAKVERILSIGSCDGYIDVYFKKLYIKLIITKTGTSKSYNQSQNCFVIAFDN